MMVNYDDLVILDFETYYADDYSLGLKQYNTSEYIRDEQFLIHGVGIQCMGHRPYWVSGHDQALHECQALDLHDRPVVAHNMAFDGFILHEHADIHCGFYCDTLSMSRAVVGHHVKHSLDALAQLFGLGAKTAGLEDTKNKRILTADEARRLGDYCINDVVLTAQLFEKMRRYLPVDEMRLIDLTLRMFCDPRLRVDTSLARLALEREISHKEATIEAANTIIEELRSADKFADLLREQGVEPPLKPSPTHPEKQIYAFAKTDQGFRELQVHPQEEVRLLAEARLRARSTINETRAERLLKAGDGYPLPIFLNFAGAHTLRWSGGNKLNAQNFPRGGILRLCIMAPEGHKLIIFDQSQIEARFVVLFCGQTDMVDAFATGEDVYVKMAARIYNKPEAEITKDERFIGKVCVLGMGYGMGWKKLRLTLRMGFMGRIMDLSPDFARRIVNTYRAANPHVVRMWDRLNVLLYQMSYNKDLDYQIGPVSFQYRQILLPNGAVLKYPGLTATDDNITYQSRNGKTYIWGGMLLENIIQALARCVIGENMLAIDDLSYFVATMTHDEIVTIVPDDSAERAFVEIEKLMTTPPIWAPDLPLEVEGDCDDRYTK
jgi:DNA polymerase